MDYEEYWRDLVEAIMRADQSQVQYHIDEYEKQIEEEEENE